MCGIFGIYNHSDAAELTYLGLYALQHRGQESAGIVSSDKKNFCSKIGLGEVQEVFSQQELSKLHGKIAIGHVRYSTCGSSELKNAQPIVVKYSKGLLSLAHNGNLVNAKKLRTELENKGAIFQSTTDSEIILHLISHSRGDLVTTSFIDILKNVLLKLKGAYSLLLMTPDSLYAIRDPNGFRPLVLGKLNNSYVVSSETCALDIIGAEFVREIYAGEIVEIKNNKLNSYKFVQTTQKRFCIFEYIYFSRPDSFIEGKSVNSVRIQLGRNLFRELPTEGDIVISVPDSANSAALGYAWESKIPFGFGFIRNHYIGRTFIQPHQNIRNFSARIKYNTVKDVIKNKRVIVVDDSIVRGTTSKKLITMLKTSGAKEIHLRITASPIINSCTYGIDTPTKKELIAVRLGQVEEIKKFLSIDSLYYLSIDGMLKSISSDPKANKNFCLACFNNNYPV